jgi:hypothetical protein
MRRERFVLVVVAATAALALSAGAFYVGTFGTSTNSAADQELRPLPPGPPRFVEASALVKTATLDEMIDDAPIVFEGRVTAVGGSEVVSPVDENQPVVLTVHRTRFDVMRPLHGEVPTVVDIAQLDGDQAVPFKVGEIHVVFADDLRVGTKRLPALMPYGASQGVYRQVATGVFRNDRNGSIALNTLAARLEKR